MAKTEFRLVWLDLCVLRTCTLGARVYVCVCWPFFCFLVLPFCRQSMTNLDVERLVSFNNFAFVQSNREGSGKLWKIQPTAQESMQNNWNILFMAINSLRAYEMHAEWAVRVRTSNMESLCQWVKWKSIRYSCFHWLLALIGRAKLIELNSILKKCRFSQMPSNRMTCKWIISYGNIFSFRNSSILCMRSTSIRWSPLPSVAGAISGEPKIHSNIYKLTFIKFMSLFVVPKFITQWIQVEKGVHCVLSLGTSVCVYGSVWSNSLTATFASKHKHKSSYLY